MVFSFVSIVILLLLIVGFVVILLFVFATRQTGRENVSMAEPESSGMSAYASSKLLEAKDLLDRGAITEEEFQQMKKEILGK